MAIVVATQVRVNPGKRKEALERLSDVKKMFQRGGASVRVFEATVAGANTGVLTVVAESSDLAQYASVLQKLQGDSDWQKFQEQAQSADAPSTVVGRSILTELLV